MDISLLLLLAAILIFVKIMDHYHEKDNDKKEGEPDILRFFTMDREEEP